VDEFSVPGERIADKNFLANYGLIAGFIGSKIVQRQRQGFWLDITLGLGGLLDKLGKTGLANAASSWIASGPNQRRNGRRALW
jgi:uncharacterized protein YidB (DUF937 family)